MCRWKAEIAPQQTIYPEICQTTVNKTIICADMILQMMLGREGKEGGRSGMGTSQGEGGRGKEGRRRGVGEECERRGGRWGAV